MVYTVELSFDARKHSTTHAFCQSQRELALEYECEFQYFMNDVQRKKKKFIKNDCIQVVHFPENKTKQFIDFIKDIYKKKMVYIECIYSGDNIYNFIYISGRYLKRMNKIDAKELKAKYKNKIEKKDFEQEILDIFHRT